ncbi:hypothetical protein RJ640_028677, partial [Escallonia rubra]
MASSVRVFLAITLLAAIAISSFAIGAIAGSNLEYLVGDEKGWSVGTDYQAWAQGKEFYVGDLLVFKYREGAHNVHQVDEASFIQCAPPTTSVPLTSGNDAIKLIQPGNNYFLCSIDSHCATGNLKLMVTVLPQVPAPPNTMFPFVPAPPIPDDLPQVPAPPYNWPHFSAAGHACFDYFAWIVAACVVLVMIP